MIILKSKLLNKKSIPPACEYCSRGSCAPDGKTVLCPKKGVMQKNSSCSAFRYDPLKRKPKLPLGCRSSTRAISSCNEL